jgi:F-type H+-transporting ATPase subunit delta
MPTPRSTARRYAEAALSIAERDSSLETWVAALETATGRLGAPELMRVLADPALSFDARRSVAEQVMGDTVTGGPRNLVLLLVRRGRIELLPEVAAQLRRLYDQRQGIVKATVTSASPLTDADVSALRDRLAGMTGGRVDISLQVDPDILGGVMVRVGDRLIDGSIRGRLERLRTRLAAGAL